MDDNNYYYKLIGKNLSKYRNFADLTQEKIANDLDSASECISRIENSKDSDTFSLAMVGRLADYISIPIWYLFDEENVLRDILREKTIHTEDYFYELFRLNLRRYRKALRITQSELAKKAKLDKSTIGRIESSKVRAHFTIHTISKIVNALEIPIVKLFNPDGLDLNNDFKRK